MWIVLWSIRIVYEAISEWVVEDESKWSITLGQLLDPADEYFEVCAVSTVTSEWIYLLELVRNFSEHALNCRVDAAKSSWLQFKVNLWDLDEASLALEHVSVDIYRVLHVESDLRGFG